MKKILIYEARLRKSNDPALQGFIELTKLTYDLLVLRGASEDAATAVLASLLWEKLKDSRVTALLREMNLNLN